MYILKFTISLMPHNCRLNLSLLKDLLQVTMNKTTKNVANIDHYDGDEMRHMYLSQSFAFRLLHHKWYLHQIAIQHV